MFTDQKILGIIPARGGSKRLLGKNLKSFCGKPLIDWTWKCADQSKYIDSIYLSTDSEEIANHYKKITGNQFDLRPPDLATDDSPITDTINYILDYIGEEYDWFILLQPTSPLRLTDDIDDAIEKTFQLKANSCISVSPVNKSIKWHCSINNDKVELPFSDQSEDIYLINGAIYLCKTDWFKVHHVLITHETIAYKMPYLRSIDVDYDYEFRFAEMIHKNTF